MKIYKYGLVFSEIQEILLPKGAKILTVQCQNKMPYIWALINEKETTDEARVIAIRETGSEFDIVGEYIGTYQRLDGFYVFHVFEITKNDN